MERIFIIFLAITVCGCAGLTHRSEIKKDDRVVYRDLTKPYENKALAENHLGASRSLSKDRKDSKKKADHFKKEKKTKLGVQQEFFIEFKDERVSTVLKKETLDKVISLAGKDNNII